MLGPGRTRWCWTGTGTASCLPAPSQPSRSGYMWIYAGHGPEATRGGYVPVNDGCHPQFSIHSRVLGDARTCALRQLPGLRRSSHACATSWRRVFGMEEETAIDNELRGLEFGWASSSASAVVWVALARWGGLGVHWDHSSLSANRDMFFWIPLPKQCPPLALCGSFHPDGPVWWNTCSRQYTGACAV